MLPQIAARMGLDPGSERFERSYPQRVALLVENPAHAAALADLLPGWVVCQNRPGVAATTDVTENAITAKPSAYAAARTVRVTKQLESNSDHLS